MRPETTITRRVDTVGQAIAQGLGERIACVAVYGSAAGDEFTPELSDVNLLVVLKEIAFADLRLIGATLERHATRDLQFATPLVIRPGFLDHARDSFPIELEDIRRRHRILAGEDLLTGLRVPAQALRVAAERECRSAVLRMHSLAIHRPSDLDLRVGIARMGAGLALIGSALLDRPPGTTPPRGTPLLTEIAHRAGLKLEGFTAVLEMREGRKRWPEDRDLDALVGRLLGELEALVAAIDAGRI